MKAQLTTITKEMTESSQLAEALNEMAHKREMAIFGRLNEMEANIIHSLNQTIEKRIVPTEKRVIALMKHFGLDPDKDLLTEH